MKKRIDNLEFRPSSYLGEAPEHSSWEIVMWEPNRYYGNEDQYEKDGDYYLDPKYSFHRIHRSCFKNPEYCFTIASFNYDKNEDFYTVQFCGDRPFRNEVNWKVFKQLLEFGNTFLNYNETT